MSIHISIFKALLLSCLVITLTACGGSGEGTPEIKQVEVIPPLTPPPPVNQAPIITLNDEYSVTEYSDITISAEAEDSDGKVISYLWQQKSGLNVNLPETLSSILTFNAPNVSEDQQLTFELTITDDDNAQTTKTTTVTIKSAIDDIADMTFKDDNFAVCVMANAAKKNWQLASEFTSLFCLNQGIGSTDEIENFINLTSLIIANGEETNNLLSKSKTLNKAATTRKKLKTLDISKLTKLEDIDLSDNELTDIDLSNQPNLRHLNLDSNLITEIDIRGLSNIETIHLEGNPINEETLEILTGLSALGGITIYFPNKSPTITLNDEYSVTEYSDITVSALAEDSDGNITHYQWQQISGLTLNVPETASSTLSFRAPNVSEEQQLTFELTVTDNDNAQTTKTTTVTIKAANDDIADMTFKDDNFAVCVMANAEEKNWQLAREFTSLSCINQGSGSTDEIEHFINLTSLIIANTRNKLKTLDISKLTKLEDIDLSDNELTDIDLSNQPNLRHLNLDSNLITEIDIRGLSNIETIHLEGNPINEETLEILTGLSALGGITIYFPNKSPTITLNDEYSVTEYSDITVSALAEDSDGNITHYQWQQISGLTLNVPETASSTLSFRAPNVSEEQQLTFELTVTDNESAQTTKEITIRLQALAGDIKDIAFVDENFKRCVLDTALAHNWQLATDFTELSCTEVSIISVADLKAFVNLTLLNLSHNRLTDIDLTAQTQLTTLDLGSNLLTDIDLSAQTELTRLYLRFEYYELNKNILTAIDLSAQTQLTELDLSGNELTAIDLSAQTQLTYLNLGRNKLTDIDLPTQTQLTHINLIYNQLTDVDLTAQTQLNYLDLSLNQLTPIDFTSQTQLTSLYLSINKLTAIDLPTQSQMTHINLSYNQLTDVDLTAQTQLTYFGLSYNQLTAIDLTTQTQLISLVIVENQLTNIDLPAQTKLTTLDLHHNQLTYIDLTAQTQLTTLNLYDNQLIGIDLPTQMQLTTLNLHHKQLTGIDLSTQAQLTSLYLYSNNLTEIDLTAQTQLTTLNLDNNQLTYINLTTQTQLTRLDLYRNNLTNIDLTAQTQLTTLDLGLNQLTDIDLPVHTQLIYLDLSRNQLIDVDLTAQTKLTRLNLDHNQLTDIDLSAQTLLIKLWIRYNPLTATAKQYLDNLNLAIFY